MERMEVPVVKEELVAMMSSLRMMKILTMKICDL